MTTPALQGLPVAGSPPPGAPSAPQGQDSGDAGLLSGEQFLQMLLGLAAEPLANPEAPSVCGAGLPGKDEEAGGNEAADGAAVSQASWLPLASFIASAVKAAPDAASAQASGGRGSAALPSVVLATQADAAIAASGSMLDATDAAPHTAEGSLAAAGSDQPVAPTSLAQVQTLAAAATLVAERPAAGGAGDAFSLQQHISAPLHSARWTDEVGRRVALLAVNGAHSGELTLVPEKMGPIEVRIQMSQDTANVVFSATQADTRAALQDALPRLREMFAATGLALGEAQVSQQMPRREGEAPALPRSAYATDDETAAAVTPLRQPVGVGLVDTYA
ncbi:MAG: flagellar hook-length control protein FliK [Steroidobacteraceae bacterium]